MTSRGLHITGASGAGVSTLGAALAQALGRVHLDTDDFYWLPIEPPFHASRPRAERLDLLRAAFDAAPQGWVLSGSMDTWAGPVLDRFEAVLFVDTPTPVRLARLRAREARLYGDRIEPGGSHHTAYVELMTLAASYDTGEGPVPGRSRLRHEAWLKTLPCPVLRLDGERPTAELVAEVLAALP